MNTTELDDNRNEHPDENQTPWQILGEEAFDNSRHERCLRSRVFLRTNSVLDALNLHRSVYCLKRQSDYKHRNDNTNNQTDLLPDWCSADDVPSFQILARGTGVCRSNTDDATNRKCECLIDITRPANCYEDETRCHQG